MTGAILKCDWRNGVLKYPSSSVTKSSKSNLNSRRKKKKKNAGGICIHRKKERKHINWLNCHQLPQQSPPEWEAVRRHMLALYVRSYILCPGPKEIWAEQSWADRAPVTAFGCQPTASALIRVIRDPMPGTRLSSQRRRGKRPSAGLAVFTQNTQHARTHPLACLHKHTEFTINTARALTNVPRAHTLKSITMKHCR